MKKNARESGERRCDQSRSDPALVRCLIACTRRVYRPGSRRQEQSVTQRFGNPTIGKQRKSKQFKSARVVKTLPRTGVLLPTFLTSARGAQPNRGSVSFVGYPLPRMTGHDATGCGRPRITAHIPGQSSGTSALRDAARPADTPGKMGAMPMRSGARRSCVAPRRVAAPILRP